MTTTQYLSVATTHTIMAQAAMWQGRLLAHRMWFCAKYPVVGAGGDRSP